MFPNYSASVISVEWYRVMQMIRLNVQNLLDSKNKTRYWLVKQMDSNYETVNRLCDNQSTALQLETIEKLCDAFECTPNDLFRIEK